jgi:hypothetical protein
MKTCTIKFAGQIEQGVLLHFNERTATVVAPFLFAAKRRFARVRTLAALQSSEKACVLVEVAK